MLREDESVDERLRADGCDYDGASPALRTEPVDNFGEQALFYGESVRYIPNAVTRYRKETFG